MIVQIRLDDKSLVAINISKICQVDWSPENDALVVIYDGYLQEVTYGCGSPEQARITYHEIVNAMIENIK